MRQNVKRAKDAKMRYGECFAMPHNKGLFQIRTEKNFNLVERYLFEIVIQVGMVGIGNDQQFLVVASQFLIGILAEIARMGFLSVDKQDGAADFACV